MATYKVLQDIEAEDKFVGPLTLKQFIFAGIVGICLYLSVLALTRGIWIVGFILLPVIIVFGFLAWPWGRDQPTEVWLLAKIRYYFKTKRRIWDQSGVSDLVTITVPKKAERPAGMDLSQTEVKSRLRALADTIDSRGWAVKNANVNLFAQPGYASKSSDRLIDASSLPQEVSNADINPADDILDAKSNPVAQHLDQMMTAAAQVRRQAVVQSMKPTKKPSNTDEPAPDFGWFMNTPDKDQIPSANLTAFGTQMANQPKANTNPTPQELAVMQRVKAEHLKKAPSYGNTKVIHTLDEQKAISKEHKTKKKELKTKNSKTNTQSSSASTPDPAILGLASNDDLNVATIARQAKRDLDKPGDEVVIPLR